MFEQFTKEQVRILKKICENPIFKQTKPVQLVVKNKTLKDLRLDICNHYDITEDIFWKEKRVIQSERDEWMNLLREGIVLLTIIINFLN